jgi:hypothetical protein
MFPRTRIFSCLAFLVAILIPASSWAQAHVNESLETASLYVDGTHGSDSNSGTKLQPLATITKAATLAMDKNAQGVGTRVIINPGTYREAIAISKPYHGTAEPVTFEAATNGTVIVSGADVWTGWSPSGSLYTHAWPYRWGACAAIPSPAPLQQQIMLRREMIFINGTHMTQVLSKTSMQPGTFFVNESSATVYVWPPSGTDMATATVEVATRPTLFSDNRESNVVLRGMTFQYANTCRGYAAVSFSSSITNILVDSDSVNWNNASGLAFLGGAENFTVQSSFANHNGQKGFATHQVKYGLWQSDTANYNNWRGAQSAFYVYDSGAFRLFLDHNGTFNNPVALFNETNGIHFDTDNENAILSSPLLADNLYGFLLEKSQGPVTVSNGYFCLNNLQNQVNVGGFDFRNSPNATLTGNIFFANLENQITVNGTLGGVAVRNWETGQSYSLITEHETFSKNTIATNSSSAQTVYDSNLGGTSWTDFATTLNSNYNYWSAGNSTPFLLPSPKLRSKTSFSGWQNLTLQDRNSTWGAKVSEPSQCSVRPDHADFWLLANYINGLAVSGGKAPITVSTVSLGGLTGTVKLSIDGLAAISGASASFSPASISVGGYTVLTVSTKSTTPKGTYPITIIANSGNLTRTVTVSVIVP